MTEADFIEELGWLAEQNKWSELVSAIEKQIECLKQLGFEESSQYAIRILTRYCDIIPDKHIEYSLIARLLGLAVYSFFNNNYQQAAIFARKASNSSQLKEVCAFITQFAKDTIELPDVLRIEVDPDSFAQPLKTLTISISILHGSTLADTSLDWLLGGFNVLSVVELFTTRVSRPLPSGESRLSFGEVNQISTCNPENAAEALNCSYLATPTFWFNVLENDNVCLLVNPPREGPGFLRPCSSFYISIEMGIIGYIFIMNQTIVIPLYSGMGSYIEGLAIGDLERNQISLITNSKTGLSLRCLDEVGKALQHLFASKPWMGSSATKDLKHFLLIGSRVSFGHTIINDSAYLGIIRILAKNNIKYNLMLANHDFFCSLHMLASIGVDAISSSKDWSTINNFKTPLENLYFFPSIVVYPIATLRPVSATMELFRGHIMNITSSHTVSGTKALYLQLDNRMGSRKILNVYELIEVVVSSCISCQYGTLVLDGLTKYPIYSRLNGEVLIEWREGSLAAEIIDYAGKVALDAGLKYMVLDNKTLPDKLSLTVDLHFAKAIAPYGSSAMTPIYLLNVKTGLLGSETYGHILEAWKWHVTRYCHPFRVTQEVYIASSRHGDFGYVVDLEAIKQFIAED